MKRNLIIDLTKLKLNKDEHADLVNSVKILLERSAKSKLTNTAFGNYTLHQKIVVLKFRFFDVEPGISELTVIANGLEETIKNDCDRTYMGLQSGDLIEFSYNGAGSVTVSSNNQTAPASAQLDAVNFLNDITIL